MKQRLLTIALASAMLLLPATAGTHARRTSDVSPAPANAPAVQGPQPPRRPVSGGITLGYNQRVSWAAKPHNGIDYVSPLNNQIVSVGTGKIHHFTKPDANRFGSINPDGKGPAVWVTYKLATGEPIYVLYGHSASSFTNKSVGSGKNFRFNCDYSIKWKAGDAVQVGAPFLITTPFYNGGREQPHLHISVFKPERIKNGKGYYDPPASGWGYSDVETSTGKYIDPEQFFTDPQYRLSPTP